MLVEGIRDKFSAGKERSEQPFMLVFGAGAVAGSVAAAATTPFDVIKTRVQRVVGGKQECKCFDKKKSVVFSVSLISVCDSLDASGLSSSRE